MKANSSAGFLSQSDRRAACRVLTSGFAEAQRDVGAAWLSQRIAGEDPKSSRLFASANSRGKIVAAAWIHLDGAAGATIAAYRSHDDPERVAVEDRLLHEIERLFREEGVKVCQLVARPELANEYAALIRHGFICPSPLIEFTVDFAGTPPEDFPLPFELVGFSDSRASEYARLLCDTYIDSLDCPELNDVRSPDETLDSLRRNSRRAQPVWYSAAIGAVPIGVVLLNPSDPGKKWELTYLGLVTGHRHQGYGKALLSVALAMSHRGGAPGMTLTTDARNIPAIRLYEAAGFRQCGSYEVYLKLFNPS